MSRFYCDFHIHSCLSPCADNDNTPNNIAGMAKLCELDIVALTDHNSTKNCPAFFEAAERYGIIPIAGMELTTSEDIHALCLFEHLSDALRFGEFIDTKRILINNRKDIFGEQLILDGEDNVIGEEEYLLSNATSLSIEDVPDLVREFGGVSCPAHIDRDANGIIAVLGTVPETPTFNLVEFRDIANVNDYTNRYGLENKKYIVSSDAHFLEGITETEFYLELDAPRNDPSAVRKELFKLLR